MLNKPIVRLGLFMAAAAAAFALFATASRTAAQEPAPPPAQTPQAELPKPLVIPEAEKNRKNPVPVVPEAIEAGRVTYSSQCAMCHGVKGDGKGELANSLKMRIPDYTDVKVQRKRTDGDLFYIMTTGHGQMPGENRLPAQSKWEIVNYLRTLARGEKSEKAKP
jgi:mono/diheme cytochrome c family protein